MALTHVTFESSDEDRPEVLHLHQIASALARDVSVSEMAGIIAKECQDCLKADAICVYILRPDDVFEMIADRGCTEKFCREWHEMPREKIEFPDAKEKLFWGSADDFKRLLPFSREQVRISGRKYIFYAQLEVDGRCVGLLGFSYNDDPQPSLHRHFISTLLNLGAQALERARLSEQQKAARSEAENANRAKTDFLANINHEIRTPLGLIQGYMDLFSTAKGLTPEQRHWASVVRKNTLELLSLIGDVLDFTKIEADRVEVEKICFSLANLIEDVRYTAELKANQKNIALNFYCTNVPETIYSDPTRLRQMLLNLIGNAIKFTAQGHVSVTVTFHTEGYLEFIVEDTGIGIAPECQTQLFQPFMQADTSTQRKFGGTGLGLAISHRYARAMGGCLELLHSVPAHGSTFRLTVPCKPALTSRQEHDSVLTSRQLEGMRLLVADDSPDNTELLGYILRAEGADVVAVNSGERVLQLVKEESFNVVLLDIQMPEMDGHQTVARLRGEGYEAPIAALTAHALSSEKRRSFESGFDDYLTKPIDRDALVRCIKKLDSRARVH